MNGLTTFLLFVTVWIAIIAVMLYMMFRAGRPRTAACCLDVPCSAKCAREHQAARDRLTVAYDRVVKEIGVIVTAGAELGSGEEPDADGDLATPAGRRS